MCACRYVRLNAGVGAAVVVGITVSFGVVVGARVAAGVVLVMPGLAQE